MHARKSNQVNHQYDILALGAGIAGINAGKQLNDLGIKKYVIFEAGQGKALGKYSLCSLLKRKSIRRQSLNE